MSENKSTSCEDSSDVEKKTIKKELSELSFEELQKLKESLGEKKFSQAMGSKAINKEVVYKRANKNRPREMSSKSRPTKLKPAIDVPKSFRRDPRFDPLCGDYSENKFHRHYEFVYEMKEEELEKLKEQLKEETDPKKIQKIKYLIERIKNQLSIEKKRKEELEKKKLERDSQIAAMKEGKSPHFTTKRELRMKSLKEKFHKLKEEGKLDSYMAKKRKRIAQKEKKRMPDFAIHE
nr:EOG090X0E8U [Cyclestheria hislopi]